jgi:single-strand DNA-binding protein
MYLNEAQISLTGYVATQPVVRTVRSGATNLSMRVAWTPRRQDRVTGEWTDGNTSYATVICWRRLATNGAVCLRKGDPVVVKGRLSVRTYEDKQGVRKVAVEVEASSVGHDLSRGVAQFQRVRPQTGLTAAEFASNGGSEQSGIGAGASAGDGLGAGLGLGPDGGFSGGLVPRIDDEYPPQDDPGPDDPFFHDGDGSDRGSADRAGADRGGADRGGAVTDEDSSEADARTSGGDDDDASGTLATRAGDGAERPGGGEGGSELPESDGSPQRTPVVTPF